MATAGPTVERLIELARDSSAPVTRRHDAFAAIVDRFHDLAYACACARLRDRALAEDATQDAFLAAWQRLDRLREPAAFPAWIRRLVLTQCHRRLRGRRLELLPQDEAAQVAAAGDAALEVEAASDAAVVQAALSRLAPADRLVLILFYGCERSAAEIADWLGVPVTTVSRRLAHAKRRLRGRTLEALAGGLRARRGDAGRSFVVELSARLRRADPDDAAGVARLVRRHGLDRDPALAAAPPPSAYLVEHPVTRAPIAYAAAVPTPFAPIYDLHLALGADALERHAGDVLLTQVVEDLVGHGAVALRYRAGSRPSPVVEFLLARGFVVLERGRDGPLLERLLRRTVAVAPERLDEYVGSYVVAGLPLPPIVIERHGDALVSKSRDMRDLLLAASECEFFTRHHHARGRFERDREGRVARLVYTDGSRELVALRQ